MQVLDVVAVKFIGRTNQRRDNIRGTGTVWKGPGDVQLVNRVDAKVLAKYSDTWEIVPMEGDTRHPTLEEAEQQVKDTPEAQQQADENRDEKIREAINRLDRDNPENWTGSGRPKVDALRSDFPDISVSEINRIWSEMENA